MIWIFFSEVYCVEFSPHDAAQKHEKTFERKNEGCGLVQIEAVFPGIHEKSRG